MLGWVFSWLLTFSGLLYGWLNPFFGLMVYYALSNLRPPFTWFWSFDFRNPPQMAQAAAISTLVGWLLIGGGDVKNLGRVKWPLFGLVLYLLSGTLAWKFTAIDERIAWIFLSTQLKIGLMAMVTLTLVTSARQVTIFAWTIVASLGYLAETFNEWYFQAPLYLWRNGWGGIDNNGVAMVMVMGVPLAFFLAINDKRWWVKGLLFFAVACMIHVVLFSFSRGGQLGLCMVGAVLFVFALVALPRKMLTLALAVVFVIIALRLAGPEVRERFWTIFADPAERDASAASRFDTWKAAIACMRDHPLGVGPRNFNLISQEYGLVVNKSVHNLFLQTGADYGIAGMIGLIIFYVGTALSCFYMSLHRVSRRLVWPRYFGQMVTISLAGFLVCSTFIGMESVEAAYIISLLGLTTVAYVRRIAASEANAVLAVLPELEQVPGENRNPELQPA